MIDFNEIPQEIDIDTAHNIMEAVGVSWQQFGYFIEDTANYGDYVDSNELLAWLGLIPS